MLRLSKLTDYAVVLLTQLVRREGGLSTTAMLAGETRLPHPTVAKILKILAKGDVLKAQRGASGGYALAHAPRDITLADIVTAMDGPIQLTGCVTGAAHPCGMTGSCHMNGRWNRVNRALRDALANVSLYELALDASPDFRPPALRDKPAAKA